MFIYSFDVECIEERLGEICHMSFQPETRDNNRTYIIDSDIFCFFNFSIYKKVGNESNIYFCFKSNVSLI